MGEIRAIQTNYKGYKFRSRLEARWAVFFDAMGIEWEYEKEGYNLDGILYLPDFWLPQVNMWAEVKPTPFDALNGGALEIAKAKRLAIATGHQVLMLYGLPDFKCYSAIGPDVYDPSIPAYLQGPREYTYVVTSADGHGYVWNEHRFYGSPGDETTGDGLLEDAQYAEAVHAARSARFEHGETPVFLTKPLTPKPTTPAAKVQNEYLVVQLPTHDDLAVMVDGMIDLCRLLKEHRGSGDLWVSYRWQGDFAPAWRAAQNIFGLQRPEGLDTDWTTDEWVTFPVPFGIGVNDDLKTKLEILLGQGCYAVGKYSFYS